MNDLPNGWTKAPLPFICTKITDGTHHSPVNLPIGKFKYVTAKNIKPWGLDLSDISYVDANTHREIYARCPVEKDDVLYIKDGATTGLAVVNPLDEPFSMLSSVALLKLDRQAIEPGYLKHWLNSPDTRSMMLDKMTGTAIRRLTLATISAQSVTLAPLPEQRRIVEKVDSLTARTARARKELNRIPTLIDRYKSAVLTLAFSGRLTQDWRRKVGHDVLSEGEFPEGWAVKELGEISQIQGGIQVGKKRPEFVELVQVPYLRVANVQRGWLNLDEIKILGVTATERDRLLLEDGDILMNEGGDRDKLGRGWVWRSEIPECIHQNHVFRVRLNEREFPPEYVSHFANENGQRYFIDQGTQTTNLASISKRKVSALPMPVPPTDEAIEIVRRIESAFAWLDRIAADHTAAARLLSKLDATIIAKAFRGQLVPQDPNDEPASVLLERIKAEREKAPKKRRGRIARNTVSSEDLKTMAKNLEQVLAKAGDWISAQDVFQQCGISGSATTEDIERIYGELRKLDKAGKIEAEAVNDELGRKLHDRLRLKVA